MEHPNAPVDAADTEHAPEQPAGDTGVKSRRKIMKAAGAAAVGGLAWAAGQAGASASSGDNLVIGQGNDAGTDSTSLTAAGSSLVDTPTLKVDSSSYDSHVRLAGKQFGVFTNAQYGGIQAIGESFGAYGLATDASGSVGVRGDGGEVGVKGVAGTIGGVGVVGLAYAEDDGTGFGVKGQHGHPDGTGVVGSNPAGTATMGEGKIGVHGKTNADDTTEGYGVMAEAKSKRGAGLLATNKAVDAALPSLDAQVAVRAHGDDIGVYAEARKDALRGQSVGVGGNGVQGIAYSGDDGTGMGVKGEHTHPDGKGVYGSNPAGTGSMGEGKFGVYGKSQAADAVGTLGENTAPSGVGSRGRGGKIGVLGDTTSTGGSGVMGVSSSSLLPWPGLEGASGRAGRNQVPAPLVAATATGLYMGVTGVGDDIGVSGHSDAGTGVAASTTTGTALDVTGKPRFDSGGESGQTVHLPGGRAFTVPSIPAGKSSVKVTDPRITTKMFINVMLTSDPGKSGDELPSVAYIARAAGSFTIFLTDKVTKKTNFAYFFVELAPPGVV